METVLEVRNLTKTFPKRGSREALEAVADVSFRIEPGECLAVIGGSGSGKTTVAKMITRLLPADSGQIFLMGEEITHAKGKALRTIYRKMQMVFQDPMASLNPHKKILDTIAMGLDAHHPHMDQKERVERVSKMMEMVGLNPAYMNRYPNQFSGGQRQRIGLGRALIMNPKLVIADEAISALDVSIQAQVVNMFEDLQKERGLSYLFIAHDLLVVQHISDRIAVMYLGHMMELADADELMDNPIHPYTQSLLSAVPIPDPETARHSKRIVLEGDVPSPLRMPSGCPFRSRCKYATEQCAAARPELTDRGNGHMVACFNR